MVALPKVGATGYTRDWTAAVYRISPRLSSLMV